MMFPSLFRRHLSRVVLALAAALLVSSTSTASELVAGPRVVAVDNACAWPMLATLRDGTIVAAVHNEPSHGLHEGDVEVWATTDGKTWERRGIAAPHEPDTVRMNAGIGLDRRGNLIVLCSGWSNVRHPDRPKQSAFRDSTLETWVCRSADGGRTWTQQKKFLPAPAGWIDYVPFGPVIAGDDGALHVICYSGQMVDPTRRTTTKLYRAWHFRSDDDGTTWRKTAQLEGDHSETALFHLGGKRWLAAARAKATDLFRSEDDGATWSGPQGVTDANQIPAHLARLKDGRLLLTYGSRQPGALGVFAKTSSDEGRTWGGPIQVAAMLDPDGGYPSSAARSDGKIVTVYYAKRTEAHPRYHMAAVIWDAPSKDR